MILGRIPSMMAFAVAVAASASMAVAMAGCGKNAIGSGTVLARYQATVSDLDVVITEHGSLKSQKPIFIECKVNGKAVWLIAEGTTVKKGDKLIELENKDLDNQFTQTQQEKENAERALENARRELKLQELDAQKQTADAERALITAGMALEQYEKGKAPLQEQDLRLALEKASSELTDSKEKSQRMPMLLEKGFVTGTEMRVAELEAREKALAVTHKTRELEIFQQYEYPTEKSKHDAEVDNASLAKQRIAQQMETLHAQKEAEIQKQQSILTQMETRLADLTDKKQSLIVLATNDGLVVYGSGNENYNYGNRLQVGADIYQNQPMMTLPDLTDMVAEFGVNEVDISRIAEGQRVTTRVEGIDGKVFVGALLKIAPTASTDWRRQGEGKQYMTTCSLGDTVGTAFRPGMSTKVEVLVGHLEKVLHIPVDMVSSKGDEHFCYVETRGSVAKRPITLGRSNDDHVVITAGLQAGETVVMLSIDPGAKDDKASGESSAATPGAGATPAK